MGKAHPTALRQVAKRRAPADNTAKEVRRQDCPNLILAIVWFVVGVGWWTTTRTQGDVLPVIHLGGVSFSPAWLALTLCGYNMIRWWLRPRRRMENSLAAALEARRRRHSLEARPKEPTDPQFNFTEGPPASESRPEPPPSAPTF